MNSFKGHNLRDPWVNVLLQSLQMLRVIVVEDVLLGPACPDALDHGGMIASIREEVQVCQMKQIV